MQHLRSRAIRSRARLRLSIKRFKRAVRQPVHNDAKVRAAWVATPDNALREAALKKMEVMLARSTSSINNSYFKAQITIGVEIGLIVMFLTMLDQMKGMGRGFVAAGILLNATSIGLALLVTTSRRRTTWQEIIREPGVHALEESPEAEYVAVSKRAFHNRVTLIANRRILWISTWLFTVPGLALAMIGWSPRIAGGVLCAALVGVRIFRRVTGNRPPTLGARYPAS